MSPEKLPPPAKVGTIEAMAAPLRTLSCVMTLAAILAPWGAVVWTVAHLALDDHHEAPWATDDARRDAAAVLHGHGHDHATPDHSHDATAAAAPNPLPLPGLTVHPSAGGFASTALLAVLGCPVRFEPSPPQRVPIVLRI